MTMKKISNRIKRLKGTYEDADFKKVLKQLNGRAMLVVAIINNNCQDCEKIVQFTKHLESGFISKLPQLVMLYGHNSSTLEMREDRDSPAAEEKDEKSEKKVEGSKKGGLGDSRDLSWAMIPEGHGYCIYMGEGQPVTYHGIFEHGDFGNNIIDSLRRFKSSIRTLAGLPAKRRFMDNKGTGIVIETNGATPQSKIIEIENKLKTYESKLRTPVYFCKGIAQEMCLFDKGVIKYRMKGFNIDKFLRKAF
ncbi:MAG: hypothetical protein COB67_03650 [SAR324 cluster bacterium]|uniref:Uncharacterized protein n=1 Tax=SAR324 cluster bacterium TaxID=2024889 RepID=A0A2A4T7F1_9DELT|nr:MAG: hypothetical protein COB67_03650 [SAR324 cluster bacterium]